MTEVLQVQIIIRRTHSSHWRYFVVRWLLISSAILLSLRGDARQSSRQPATPDRVSISHIYIADGLEDRVVRLNGFSMEHWTSYGMRPRDRSRNDEAEGRFDSVDSVAVDEQERIYITDEGHQRLCRVDNIQGRNWVEFDLHKSPLSVFVTATGRIYVLTRDGLVSGYDHLMRMEDMSGRGLVDLAFSHGSGKMQLNEPYAVFVDAQERIYITDTGNARIVRVDNMQGNGWTTLGSRGKGISQFERPMGLFVTEQGQIYVTDQITPRIARFDDMTGKGGTVFYGTKQKHFFGSYSLWIGKDNRIYFIEIMNDTGCRIVRMDDMTGRNLSILSTPLQGLRGNGAIVVR